jgi:hypothetical protein
LPYVVDPPPKALLSYCKEAKIELRLLVRDDLACISEKN